MMVGSIHNTPGSAIQSTHPVFSRESVRCESGQSVFRDNCRGAENHPETQFKKQPHVTEHARKLVIHDACKNLPPALKNAKLSDDGEQVKHLLGVISSTVKEKGVKDDIARLDKACTMLANAAGNPKKERKACGLVADLVSRYSETAFKKAHDQFVDQSRKCWWDHHQERGINVEGKSTFNTSFDACQSVVDDCLVALAKPNQSWEILAQNMRFFVSDCASISKTMVFYDEEPAAPVPTRLEPNRPAEQPPAAAAPQPAPDAQPLQTPYGLAPIYITNTNTSAGGAGGSVGNVTQTVDGKGANGVDSTVIREILNSPLSEAGKISLADRYFNLFADGFISKLASVDIGGKKPEMSGATTDGLSAGEPMLRAAIPRDLSAPAHRSSLPPESDRPVTLNGQDVAAAEGEHQEISHSQNVAASEGTNRNAPVSQHLTISPNLNLTISPRLNLATSQSITLDAARVRPEYGEARPSLGNREQAAPGADTPDGGARPLGRVAEQAALMAARPGEQVMTYTPGPGTFTGEAAHNAGIMATLPIHSHMTRQDPNPQHFNRSLPPALAGLEGTPRPSIMAASQLPDAAGNVLASLTTFTPPPPPPLPPAPQVFSGLEGSPRALMTASGRNSDAAGNVLSSLTTFTPPPPPPMPPAPQVFSGLEGSPRALMTSSGRNSDASGSVVPHLITSTPTPPKAPKANEAQPDEGHQHAQELTGHRPDAANRPGRVAEQAARIAAKAGEQAMSFTPGPGAFVGAASHNAGIVTTQSGRSYLNRQGSNLQHFNRPIPSAAFGSERGAKPATAAGIHRAVPARIEAETGAAIDAKDISEAKDMSVINKPSPVRQGAAVPEPEVLLPQQSNKKQTEEVTKRSWQAASFVRHAPGNTPGSSNYQQLFTTQRTVNPMNRSPAQQARLLPENEGQDNHWIKINE